MKRAALVFVALAASCAAMGGGPIRDARRFVTVGGWGLPGQDEVTPCWEGEGTLDKLGDVGPRVFHTEDGPCPTKEEFEHKLREVQYVFPASYENVTVVYTAGSFVVDKKYAWGVTLGYSLVFVSTTPKGSLARDCHGNDILTHELKHVGLDKTGGTAMDHMELDCQRRLEEREHE